MIVKIVPVRICESVYTASRGVGEYSSFFREVLEYFPGRTGVLSGGDWGNFRMPVPVFSQEWPGTCGNKLKKSSCLIPLIDIHLSIPS